ncbi:MMPL family transporter [Streptomonospora wellingtoniae]|uniref:MMPL family transporter n=1 Tax=Streptomonospora wellingtoniae TaxID=3075544 RepID=A0ABU2KSZ7_9ACTN|nr:MMPL family transporter [Streptomonospora sp. DSM 45055]MDT0302397.1 MMPL family transporter [Streptomonospora sp. DSM 45055]
MSITRSPQRQDAGAEAPVPVLRRLGRFTARRSGAVLVAMGVVALAALLLAAGTLDRLVLSRFVSPGSESLHAADVLEEEFGTGTQNFLLLVTADEGTVDDARVRAAGEAVEQELAAEDGVAEAASYWSRGESPALRSEDGTQALIIARMGGDVTEARERLGELSPEYTRDQGPVSIAVGGGDEVFRQAAEQARSDFVTAEIIVLPMVLVLLWFIYRRLPAAALTLGMGLFSVVGTLALLRGVASLTEVSTFAANLTLVMGLGLGVDYSLFIINRFREEMRGGRSVAEAVEWSVATAGRTVAFSGLTVAVSLLCMLLFPFPFLRSFAYAGAGVVLTSVVAALVIMPAALARLGHRVEVRSLSGSARGAGWWRSTAVRMMRRPLLYGVPALLVLLALAAPTLNLDFGLPDDRVLPPGTSSREVQQDIRDGFAQEEMDAVQIVAPELPGDGGRTGDVAAYAAELSRVDGMAQVDAATGTYVDGERVSGPGESSDRFAAEDATWFSAVPSDEALEGVGSVDTLLADVRAVDAPSEVLIGGYPAELNDFRSQLVQAIPLVFGLILVVTFVILFLMTGSLLLPLKAIVLNVLSMGVMFGALVWVFQDGNLAGPLGVTAIGTLEPTFPLLMFCIAFGLSMDYEVFMLSRIKEEYDRTGDNTEAVAAGLQRSGPLITAAAVILAASFATYTVSGVMYLTMLGVGMALVILVDATLIRAVLVPVFMRLAGRANWWAPGPLRRIHRRLGISEV